MQASEANGVSLQPEAEKGSVVLNRINFNGFSFSGDETSRLKEQIGARKSLLAVVHPFLYEDYQPVTKDPQYSQRFKEYSDELCGLINRANEKGIPIVFFQPVGFINDEEQYTKRAYTMLQKQLEARNIKGKFYVVFTQESTPSPLQTKDFYGDLWKDPKAYIANNGIDQMVQEGKDYSLKPSLAALFSGTSSVETNLPLAAFTRLLKQVTDVEKIVIAGSYVGGTLYDEDGSGDFESQDKRSLVTEAPTDKAHIVRTRSNYYKATLKIKESKEQGNACVFKLAKYLQKAGIKVGITSSTYPERFPKEADMAKLTDTLWKQELYLDTASKTHRLKINPNMTLIQKAEMIMFVQEIREAMKVSNFVVLSPEQSARVKDLEDQDLLPDDLIHAFQTTELIRM